VPFVSWANKCSRGAAAAGWLQKERAKKRPSSQYLRFKSIFAIRAMGLNGLGTNNKRQIEKETKSTGSSTFLLCERVQRSPYIVCRVEIPHKKRSWLPILPLHVRHTPACDFFCK
jgi:hypothetical protein